MPHSGYITARDQSMFKSGVTEGGKILPVFFFVNEDNNTNTKPQAKKQRFLKLSQKRIKQQLVEEKMQVILGKYFVNHSFSGFEN